MLAKVSRKVWLGGLLFLSKWEDLTWWRDNDYILANTFEALIWAIYIDKGFKSVDMFLKNFLYSELDSVIDDWSHVNSKSKIQAYIQSVFKVTPIYNTLKEVWPDHDKVFTSWIYCDDVCMWVGTWASKQSSQEESARMACEGFWLNL